MAAIEQDKTVDYVQLRERLIKEAGLSAMQPETGPLGVPAFPGLEDFQHNY